MSKMLRPLVLITSVLIAGCSLFPNAVEPVEVVTIAERPPMWHPPMPLEMQLQAVEFEVLTPDLMQEYLALIAENKAPRKPYYALTTQQYENLSLNMGEIKRYIKNILSIIKFYRDYDKQDEGDEGASD